MKKLILFLSLVFITIACKKSEDLQLKPADSTLTYTEQNNQYCDDLPHTHIKVINNTDKILMFYTEYGGNEVMLNTIPIGEFVRERLPTIENKIKVYYSNGNGRLIHTERIVNIESCRSYTWTVN